MRSWCHGDRPEPESSPGPPDGRIAEHKHAAADGVFAEDSLSETSKPTSKFGEFNRQSIFTRSACSVSSARKDG